MKKILYILVIFSLITLAVTKFNNTTLAAGSPLKISPFHSNANSPCGVFYTPSPYSFTYNSETVWLSSLSNGTGNIYTDDKIDIEVTRPDGTKATFTKNYGNGSIITPTAPQNITTLFKSGNNNVKVTMTDTTAPVCNSSEYWLVETTSGGGTTPAKPHVLPRSTWHGDSSGATISQTPKRIAIHHTAGTNDPGNIGTLKKELELATKLKPSITLKKLFNPLNVLSAGYDPNYTAIRNTYEGSIFLDWLDHKYLHPDYGIDDLAYSYLIAPNGKIYEGRFKGGLAENADNRGSSTWHANTGLIGIAFVGRYGIDTARGESQAVINLLHGVAQPTDASIQSARSLIDWLTAKYNIDKNGQTKLPPSVDGVPSCIRSEVTNECFVNNIAGHKDYDFSTNNISNSPNDTICPGDNIYQFIPTFKFLANNNGTGTIPAHTNPSGLLIAGFSPVNLGVVDPTGKRLGVDPATGQFVTNITSGVQGKIIEGEDPTDFDFVLHIPSPVNGVYKVDVVGTGTGAFTLGTEDLASSNASAYAGNTTSGQKDNYQIIYNSTTPTKLEMFHDTVPPVTTGKMTCPRDMQGICRSTATVNLTATDTGTNGDPASGVAKIECSHDNKVTWQQCGTASGGSLSFNKNEKKSFHYRAIDRVGNAEAAKFSGVIDVQQFVALADSSLTSNLATNLETKGIAQSNGTMSFTYNTTVKLDIINHIGAFTQSGNTTFTYNQKNQITTPNPLPNYPLSYYKTTCPNFAGPLTINDTSPAYNKCMYVTGDVTFNATTPTGKLTIISEGFIRDNSTTANLTAWDTKNGVLFYSNKGYTTLANGTTYTGIVYAPTTKIDGAFSNTTLNGGLYSKTVNFGADTSLKAFQGAGFPATTYTLPL